MPLVALIILLAAVVGSAAMVAFFAWIIQRVQALESGPGPDDRALRQQVARLEDELLVVQDEMARLRETVEFTEKLLERPRTSPAPDAEPENRGEGPTRD